MSRIFTSSIIGLMCTMYAGYYLLYPISEITSSKRAKDELLYYCNDMNIDCSRFAGGYKLLDYDGYRVYEWNDSRELNVVVHVRVPYRRIGDLTFGVIGKDVTLGSLKKN